MQISRITPSGSSLTSFQRRLTESEKEDYRKNALQPAFDYLGTKEVAMILHGTCYPELEKDIGVGSPYGEVTKTLLPFEKLHGFNSNQLGPVGVIRSAKKISPYLSTVSTRNYLFLDLNALTNDKYANILSSKVINSVFENSKTQNENYSYSKFADAFANYDYCIKIAHKNFKEKVLQNDETALKLNDEYAKFKKQKGSVLYKEALFDVLSKTYGTDNFEKWDDLDANLISKLEDRNPEAVSRYKKVVLRSKEDFDTYIFGQFLLDKQIKENTQYRKNIGFKYINDLLVGFSKSDEWANKDCFLKDYRMGCPYGGQNNGPQVWDIPVLAPDKLFNDDGSLGKAGKLLKQKINSSLENFDNVRIDHALGLIDPYIYDKNSVMLIDGAVDLGKFRGGNISNFHNIDPNGNYKKVLNEIIIPTLEEHGIDKNYPVWEDLCAETLIFNDIYRGKNNLPGITQLEYMRAEDLQDEEDWGLVGSHDSPPAMEMIKKDWIKSHHAWDIFYLAGFLNSNPQRAEVRDKYCQMIDFSPRERVKAKFAELFLTCKKVQISFADFFGINKTYNERGTENDRNWKLRLNKDYEDCYYKNLASENPTAINMPEILKLAVQAKSDMNVVSQKYDLKSLKQNEILVDEILTNLDKYQKILEEPEL